MQKLNVFDLGQIRVNVSQKSRENHDFLKRKRPTKTKFSKTWKTADCVTYFEIKFVNKTFKQHYIRKQWTNCRKGYKYASKYVSTTCINNMHQNMPQHELINTWGQESFIK